MIHYLIAAQNEEQSLDATWSECQRLQTQFVLEPDYSLSRVRLFRDGLRVLNQLVIYRFSRSHHAMPRIDCGARSSKRTLGNKAR